jgi:hypothetical protein
MDADFFEREVAKRGGLIPDRPFITSLATGVGPVLEQLIAAGVGNPRMRHPAPIVRFAYTNELRVAASCVMEGDNALIALSGGSLICAFEMACRLLNNKRLFTDIGDANAERLDTPQRLETLPMSAKTWDGAPDLVLPSDRVRVRYMQTLVLLSQSSMVAHELTHILRGHLAWRAQQTRSRLRDLLVCGLPAQQVLEFDADCGAASVVVEHLRAWVADWKGTPPIQFQSLDQAIRVFALANFLSYRPVFNDPMPNDINALFRTHPPAAVRFFGSGVVTATLLGKRGVSEDLISAAVGGYWRAVAEGEHALAQIIGQAMDFTALDLAKNNEPLLRAFTTAIGELFDELAPLARETMTRPEPYDEPAR